MVLMLGVFITLTSMSSNAPTVKEQSTETVQTIAVDVELSFEAESNVSAANPLVCVGNYCCTDTYCCNLRCEFGNCCFPIIAATSISKGSLLNFGVVDNTPIKVPLAAV